MKWLIVVAQLFLSVGAYAQLPSCGEDFEPVLIPVFLPEPVDGAYGSVFTTQLLGYNQGPGVSGAWRGCDVRNPFDGTGGYEIPVGPFLPLVWNDVGNPGVMLHVSRETASSVRLSLHLASTQAGHANYYDTELPVVREPEFHSATFHLFPVVLRSDSRSLLRIYDPKSRWVSYADVRITRLTDGEELVHETLTLGLVASPATANVPGYVQLPLDNLVHERDVPLMIEITPSSQHERLWAMVTTTDNANQSVTLVTPR